MKENSMFQVAQWARGRLAAAIRWALLPACCLAAFAQISIDSGTAIMIDSREPAPLRKAAADLASDMRKVFGKDIRVLTAPGATEKTRIAVALNYNLPPGGERPSGNEVLRIAASESTVTLTGSDIRGAIYAVYEFSQRFLGVDPLWWWTDHEPARRASVTVPKAYLLTEGPAFRYRGWFLNDEDLLTGWQPGNADHTGISLAVWDRVFEALLRLKGNMIVPGTFIFPDEPQVRAASERGLVVSQHHIEVLGLNTWRWPEDKPYSFVSHPEVLASAWRSAARQYGPDQEVLWTVGYRGRHDRPFWVDDAAAPADDAGRARVIRDAIDRQIEIVRKERKSPLFVMNAWMEAVPLIQKGLLKIPDDVTLVWPDSGSGLIRDDGRMAAGQGVYYHTAMLSGSHNQLSEMVPVDRIRRELVRAWRAGATEYLLDNTSDVRPVLMTTRALMELAWDPKPWADRAHDEGARFLERWSKEEFGDAAAARVAACYRAYFAAPGRYGDAEDEVLADNRYHTLAVAAAERAAGVAAPPRMTPERMVAMCREAEPRWVQLDKDARTALTAIPPERRDFFQGHVLTQIDIHLHANRMLLDSSEAALVSTQAAKVEHLQAALQELDRQSDALAAAEYGKWQGFYRGEIFVNLRYTRDVLRFAIDRLQGKTADGPPEKPDGYKIVKAYQGDRRTAP
jgi:hypothetical protein